MWAPSKGPPREKIKIYPYMLYKLIYITIVLNKAK